MSKTRKLGQFTVANQFLREAEAGEANLFHNMIVLRAEPEWFTDRTRYLGIHPDFAPLEEGLLAPDYTAHFGPGDIYPKWRM